MRKTVFKTILGIFWGLGLSALGSVGAAHAGVATLPHFVSPGEFTLTVEPELTLSNGAGIGANVKYTQGLNELMNLTALIGSSSGPRKFRLGSDLTFDFFPDVEGQPGIGVAASGIYYRLTDLGLFEFTAIPYVHKTFKSEGNDIEPYFALPFGMLFSDGQYQATSSVVIGSMFKSSPNLRFHMEFGVAVNHAESYASGGVTYFH